MDNIEHHTHSSGKISLLVGLLSFVANWIFENIEILTTQMEFFDLLLGIILKITGLISFTAYLVKNWGNFKNWLKSL